jgi:lactate permease
VAALPIVLLLGTLGLLEWSAPKAAALGLASALGVAIFVYGMPWQMAVASAVYGGCFGLFPIGWIVLAAIFLYSLTVKQGQFEIVKASVVSLSADRRLQALLIAFSFGAFVEGAAGFGTPVAISAALMIGTGFSPLHAAGLALIANTSPVAFGALGTPIITLADVTRLDELRLSAMAGRQLPFFSLVVPAWLVWTMAGWRGVRGVWPAILVSGGSFAFVQFWVANYYGPRLVDVAGGLVSLVCLALFLKVWKPKETWLFAAEAAVSTRSQVPHYTARQIASAWVPWVLLSGCVFIWGLPQVKRFFDSRPGVTTFAIEVPGLHQRVARDVPVVETRGEAESAVFRFNWLSATGTGILLAAILSAIWMGVSPARFVAAFFETLVRMRWPLFTIAVMLAIAYTTRYSGTDATLGLAFTRTGFLYPFFAALLGWLGVALTGSDTSSNALFGSLQKITAEGLVKRGVLSLTADQASVLMAAANSTGGVMGKMIDAQSIVVSAAATQQPGREGEILRFVFWHSLALAALMGGLVMVQAYWLTWMIPK